MRLCEVGHMRKEAHPASQKLSNTTRVTSDRQQPTLGPHDLLATSNTMVARSLDMTDWHSTFRLDHTDATTDTIEKLTFDLTNGNKLQITR